MNSTKIINFGRDYAVLILIVLLMIVLSLSSDAFLTPRNLLNILNQNAPLAIIASGAFWFKILSKFLGVRNASLARDNTIINKTININTA